MRTGINVELMAKDTGFYLVLMFTTLIFRESNIICIRTFISSNSENE